MCRLADIEIGILIRKKEALQDEVCKLQAEKEKYRNIEATLNEFWDILLELQIAKRKEAPTLEEFAEALEEIRAEAVKEFAERLKGLMFGYYQCLEESSKGEPYKGDTLMDYEVVDMIEDCVDNLVKEMTEKE